MIPARELAIGNQHTAGWPTLEQKNLKVVVVEVEMSRKVGLTAQDLAGKRRLRPSLIPKSDHRVHFCRLSRRQIISQQRHEVQ
ncbi:MAG TPA: hypothetical protein VFV58_34260 [Blastocatellia bacterium]|nr:hypothetical protein [Blastocatellia bacterium]